MVSNDSIRAAAEAFESMTDEDAAAWLAAGDYTAVGGVPLPTKASQKIRDLMSGVEVEGFDFSFVPHGPDPLPIPYPNTATTRADLFKQTCTGQHLKQILLSE